MTTPYKQLNLTASSNTANAPVFDFNFTIVTVTNYLQGEVTCTQPNTPGIKITLGGSFSQQTDFTGQGNDIIEIACGNLGPEVGVEIPDLHFNASISLQNGIGNANINWKGQTFEANDVKLISFK